MNTVTYRISLDVNKNGIQRTIQGVETGDIYARSVVITLRNNKEDYELPQNGIEAIMYPILPDGTKLEGRPCDIEGNRITYRIQPGDIEQVGLVRYQLKIIGTLLGGASAVLVSPRFELEVWESDADDEPMVEAENFTELQKLIAKADAYYNTKRITDVIIDEDYLIKVIFADGTTYESDALKTLSDKVITHDEAIADLTDNKLDKHNPVVEGELTAPSISTNEIKNDGNLTLPPNVIVKEGTTYLRQNEIFTQTIYTDEIKKRSDSQPVAIDEIAIPGKVAEVGTSIVNINREISTLRTEEEADFNSVNERVNSVESAKMDKNNPTGTGTLTVDTVKATSLATNAIYPKYSVVHIDGEVNVKGRDNEYNVAETFDQIGNIIQNTIRPKVTKNEEDIAYIQDNYYKSGDDSYFNQIRATTYMGTTAFQPAKFASDITLFSDKSREIKLAPTIESMQSDIEDLKHRPSGGASLTLTSASPLTNSTQSAILGIDALGKSEQKTTFFEQGTYTSASDGKTFEQIKQDSPTRIRLNDVVESTVGSSVTISCASEFELMVKTFNASKIFVYTSGWASNITFTASNYYALIIRKVDGSNITPSEASSAKVVVSGASSYTPTPTNPIPIIDASGEVSARHNIYNSNDVVRGQYYTSNGSLATNQNWGYVNVEILPNGTYKVVTKGAIWDAPCTVWLNANKSFISVAFNRNSDAIQTVTAPSNAKYLGVTLALSATYKEDESLEVLEGNTITLPYILKSVGDIKDELIVNKDGTGKLIQNIERKKLKELGYNAYDSGNKRFVFNVSNVMIAAARTLPMLCDCYTAITDGRAIADVPTNSVYASGDGTRLYVHDYSTTDGSTLLATIGNMYVYYPLATPIITDLTASEVASIRALQTYDGTTIVDSEMEIASVDYAGDIKGYIDSKFDYLYELIRSYHPEEVALASEVADE